MTTDESRTRCPVCGTELHTGANFCYACGENMRTKEEPTTDETEPIDVRKPDPSSSHTVKRFDNRSSQNLPTGPRFDILILR